MAAHTRYCRLNRKLSALNIAIATAAEVLLREKRLKDQIEQERSKQMRQCANADRRE